MAVKKRTKKSSIVEAHLLEHDRKLSYILNEVSANGNPGLDNSLKDLYKGQKEIKASLQEIITLIKPDMDRANMYKAIREAIKSNGIVRFCQTKVGFAITATIGIIIVNTILHPFVGTGITITALWELVKKVVGL